MFSLRSARGRAILAGVVLVLLLASLATVAVWRARDMQQQHRTLEHTSAVATALEHAQAEFWRAQAELSALVFSDDPALVDNYHDAAATIDQNLSQARAEALIAGEADKVAALDDLAARIGQFNDTANLGLSLLLEADIETGAQLASVAFSEMASEAKAIIADLERLVDEEQQELAAATAAADRTADTTLWLLIGFGAATLVVAVGAIAMLIVSVIRPLAALRASARAVTSGDSEARAKVAGPEEVASLARDFNEMTDALSAKTKEYIDTTNLTGVMLLKVDKDGRCIFLNDATSEFLGRPKEEILGAEVARYLHPDDVEPTTQALREMTKSKEPIRGVVSRYVTPLGTRVAEWNAHPLFDEEGQYAGFQGTGRDITERKRAEEELEASRRTLENTTQGITDSILLLSKDLDILWANKTALEQAGYEMGQTLGNHCYEVTHHRESPCDGRLDPCPIQEVQRTGKPATATHTHLGAEGKEISAEVTVYPVRDEKGEIIQFVHVSKDITERKQAEQALASSEQRLKILFEFAPDAYYLNDLQGNFVDGNKAAQELIGYKREELVGKSFLELNLLSPEQLPKAAANLAKNAQGLPSGPDEFALNRKDGSQVPVEIRTFPVTIKDQTLVLGIARDITARKRAEEALRDSEERYRDLFENATDLVQSAAPDGSLVYVNRAWREALGYEESEIAALSLFDIIHPDSKAHCTKIFQRVMTGAKVDHIEAMFLTKHGRTIWVEGSASCRFEDGEPVATRGIFHDITERKQAQEERDRLHAELQVRAITDGLTGLYNHAHFFERLAEEIDRSKRYRRGFSLVMMDVDKFKQFNDTRGHQAGDDALCLIADCIRTGVRRSDIAFRYGGDEFAAILLHADSSRAQAIAKRINRCLTRRLEEANDPAAAWLGLSTGIACFPDDATTADDLVKVADTALYDAKRVSRPCSAIEQEQAAEPLAAARAAGRNKG